MSDRKPESWWSSFDHVLPGTRKGAQRLQADREAKFDNKYGRNLPHEQQPQHQGGPAALGPGKDEKANGEDSAPVELAEGNTSPQREEHDDAVELLHDTAQELENQQQLDQQQQDLELPNDNRQGGDKESDESEAESASAGTRTPPASPPRVESDDEEMTGTKIGIPKFTGQETDVSDKARDWFTGLQTYFTEKNIANGEWERRCGLIRWSLMSDSIPDGQDSTSASSWFKGIMEDDGPGGRVFTSFTDFRDKFEKRWITGTLLEEVSNIFRRLTSFIDVLQGLIRIQSMCSVGRARFQPHGSDCPHELPPARHGERRIGLTFLRQFELSIRINEIEGGKVLRFQSAEPLETTVDKRKTDQ